MTTPSPPSPTFAPVYYGENADEENADFRASNTVVDVTSVPDVDTIDHMTTPSPPSPTFSPVYYGENADEENADFRASNTVVDVTSVPDVDTIDHTTPQSAISPIARQILMDDDDDDDDDIESDFPMRKLPLGVPDDDTDEELSGSDNERGARHESQHSLPDVDELKLSLAAARGGGSLSSFFSPSNRKRIIYPLLLVLFGAAVIVFFAASAKGANPTQIQTNQKATQSDITDNIAPSNSQVVDDDAPSKSQAVADDAPSKIQNFDDDAPSNNEVAVDRLTHLLDYMVKHGVTSLEDFHNNGESSAFNTPQAQAARWMSYEDNQFPTFPRIDQDPTTDEGYALVSRYAMAILYFATNGKNWENSLSFLDPDKATCDWNIVLPPPTGEVGVLCNQTTRRIIGLSLSKYHYWCVRRLCVQVISNDITNTNFLPIALTLKRKPTVSNNVVGTMPTELSQITSMQYLELIENDISGSIPLEWQELTDLKTLVVAFNQLTGTLPAWMPQSWPDMEFMYLSNNQLTGTIPEQFFAFKKLAVLALDDNLLTGKTDVIWDNLKSLEYLYLEDNDFTGTLPRLLSESIPNIITLDISSNRLSGFLPTDLFHFNHLEILDMHDNRFQLPIPNDIPEDNNSLKFLALHKNLLNGQIPSSIANLKRLSHLDLTRNYLTGTMPNELERLSNSLTYLFLGWNDYNEGPIPSFVYALTNLRELSLKSSNRIGNISPVIGALDTLQVLDLNDNGLTGSIPNEIGLLRNLEYLLLNRNELSMEVPGESMGQLSSLRFLLLDNNHVFGDLNPICKLNFLTKAYVDCGEVACLEGCCSCCTDGSACHDNAFIKSHDPVWESGYTRQFFDMNEESFHSNRDDDYWQ